MSQISKQEKFFFKHYHETRKGSYAGKRAHRRPRRRWEENIKTDLEETGWEGVNCIHLTQDKDMWRALVKTIMKIRVPYREENFLIS